MNGFNERPYGQLDACTHHLTNPSAPAELVRALMKPDLDAAFRSKWFFYRLPGTETGGCVNSGDCVGNGGCVYSVDYVNADGKFRSIDVTMTKVRGEVLYMTAMMVEKGYPPVATIGGALVATFTSMQRECVLRPASLDDRQQLLPNYPAFTPEHGSENCFRGSIAEAERDLVQHYGSEAYTYCVVPILDEAPCSKYNAIYIITPKTATVTVFKTLELWHDAAGVSVGPDGTKFGSISQCLKSVNPHLNAAPVFTQRLEKPAQAATSATSP